MYLQASYRSKDYCLLWHETTADKLRSHFIADKSQGLLSRACCCKLHFRVCVRVPVWGVCPCALVRGGRLVCFRAAVASLLFVFWMSACCLSFADERPFAHGSWPVNGAELRYGQAGRGWTSCHQPIGRTGPVQPLSARPTPLRSEKGAQTPLQIPQLTGGATLEGANAKTVCWFGDFYPWLRDKCLFVGVRSWLALD